jgi:hypothetical protein
MPIGWAIVVIVQWLAIIALTVVILGILRMVTPHLEEAPARPRLRDQGPAVGSKLPAFTGSDGSGEIASAELMRGQPSILLFLSATCGPCLNLARDLATSDPVVELADSLIVMTAPGATDSLKFPAWVRILFMPDRECAEVLGIRGRPFALAVDADQVVTEKRPVNTVAQLTALTTSALEPVPLAGD